MTSATSPRRLPVLLLAGLLATLLAACGDSSTNKPQPTPAVGPLDGFGAPTLGTTSYTVPAGARFVAPDGDDAAAGTSAAPWRTLERAVAAAPSGSTIVMREGTYREGVEIPATKRLTIQPASGESVWLAGSDLVGTWTRQDSSSWRTRWSHNVSGGTLDPTLVDPAHPMAGDPDQLFVDGRRLTQVASRAALAPGTFFVDEANDTLWMADDPTGRTIEASVRADGLTIKSPGTVVRGIGFRHYATPIARLGAVKAAGNAITIEDAVFTDNAAAGLAVSGDDVRVANVTAVDNGQLGIQANGANRLTVENSLVRRNNLERFSAIAASGGIKLVESDGVVLRHNLAEENLAHGLWMDLSSDDAKVVRNITRRNTAAGIIIEMSLRPVFASNAAVANGVGIVVSETSNAQLWNNALVDNGIATHVLDGRRAPRPVDITLRNNIISSRLASSRPLVIVDDVNQLRSGFDMRVSMDRNAYFRRSTAQHPYVLAWANYPTNKLVLRTLTDVQGRTGQDRTSKILDDATDDPNVDDLNAGLYGLPPGRRAVRRRGAAAQQRGRSARRPHRAGGAHRHPAGVRLPLLGPVRRHGRAAGSGGRPGDGPDDERELRLVAQGAPRPVGGPVPQVAHDRRPVPPAADPGDLEAGALEQDAHAVGGEAPEVVRRRVDPDEEGRAHHQPATGCTEAAQRPHRQPRVRDVLKHLLAEDHVVGPVDRPRVAQVEVGEPERGVRPPAPTPVGVTAHLRGVELVPRERVEERTDLPVHGDPHPVPVRVAELAAPRPAGQRPRLAESRRGGPGAAHRAGPRGPLRCSSGLPHHLSVGDGEGSRGVARC